MASRGRFSWEGVLANGERADGDGMAAQIGAPRLRRDTPSHDDFAESKESGRAGFSWEGVLANGERADGRGNGLGAEPGALPRKRGRDWDHNGVRESSLGADDAVGEVVRRAHDQCAGRSLRGR